MLQELLASVDRIERYLKAETAVQELEQSAGVDTSALPTQPRLPIALCQVHVGVNKATNLVGARQAIDSAASSGAKIVCLPECFNSPYDTSCFPEYAEAVPESAGGVDTTAHPTTSMLIAAARENQVYLVGGSFPERGDDGAVYNTCLVVSPEGEIIARHRKMHLFDIDVPGRITFRESDTLTAGDDITVFDTPYGRVGVGICYDLRFPEQSMIMRQRGCKILVFPGAFNMTTGPAHWELLLRARALDNQCYVAAVSPARDESASYHAWGHSTVVSPWGDVVATTEHAPDTVRAVLDMGKVEEVRTNIPVSKQRRSDVYSLLDYAAPDVVRRAMESLRAIVDN